MLRNTHIKIIPQQKVVLQSAWPSAQLLVIKRLSFADEGWSGSGCRDETEGGIMSQGVFLWTLRVCTLGFWVPKPWNMALNKGIWDPKLRGTNIKGTNSKSLNAYYPRTP